MIPRQTSQYWLQQPFVSYSLFWLCVFLFYAGTANWYAASSGEILTTYGIRVGLQFFVATSCVFYGVPRLQARGAYGKFTIFMLLVVATGYVLCSATRYYYLEVNYPAAYSAYVKRFTDPSFSARLLNPREVVRGMIILLYPTFPLLAIKFYRDQQQLLRQNEKRKEIELSALKNQLNPHFLFNTLNNLYSLAVMKSDHTARVIEKLSDILDYCLYGCTDTFVAVKSELTMIDNYLALEKLRYGERVEVRFDHQVADDPRIAPLLLLSFVENAFKHGVSQETGLARVEIDFRDRPSHLEFRIRNSKPVHSRLVVSSRQQSIGLNNVVQQLNLLYPQSYDLDIQEGADFYAVELKLKRA